MQEIIAQPSSTSTPGCTWEDPDASTVAAWVNEADPNAFARLVALHHAYVHRVALSVLGPACEADAEDVVQEVFLRVAARLRDFRGQSRFRTWLHRLALNVALDHRRRPRWHRPHLDDSVLENSPATDSAGDPFARADAGERARAVCECLDGLPDSLRSVIHLRYWLDLSLEEVAGTLRIPLGTVKSHLHRGRALLFHAMQARGFDLTGEVRPSAVPAAEPRQRSPHPRHVPWPSRPAGISGSCGRSSATCRPARVLPPRAAAAAL